METLMLCADIVGGRRGSFVTLGCTSLVGCLLWLVPMNVQLCHTKEL